MGTADFLALDWLLTNHFRSKNRRRRGCGCAAREPADRRQDRERLRHPGSGGGERTGARRVRSQYGDDHRLQGLLRHERQQPGRNWTQAVRSAAVHGTVPGPDPAARARPRVRQATPDTGDDPRKFNDALAQACLNSSLPPDSPSPPGGGFAVGDGAIDGPSYTVPEYVFVDPLPEGESDVSIGEITDWGVDPAVASTTTASTTTATTTDRTPTTTSPSTPTSPP
jgi:hypothetical protein